MTYQDVLINLTNAGVRYLVVGGTAANFLGYQHLTLDLDILPDLEKSNLEKIIQIMKSLGYTPRLPVNPMDLLDEEIRREWHEKRNMLAFSYMKGDNPREGDVDYLIYHPLPFEGVFARKKVVHIKETPIYVVSIDDLITMKRLAGRTKDLYTIKILEIIKKEMEDEQLR